MVFVFRFFTTEEAHRCLLSVFFLSRRNRTEARASCFSALLDAFMVAILSYVRCGFYVSHVATPVSCSVPFCQPHGLPDFIKPPSFPSMQQAQGWPSLPCNKGQVPASASSPNEECCESQPLVHHTSPHHSQNNAIHVRTP